MFNNKSAPTILTNRLFIRVVDRADFKDYNRFCSKINVCVDTLSVQFFCIYFH